MPARVLVSLPDERQEYQALQGQEARAAAQRLGLDVEVSYCQGDPAQQIQQIKEAIQEPAGSRPAAVVLHLIAVGALESIAYQAVKARVGWIVLDPAPYLDRLRKEFPDRLIALVTTDNRAMGQHQAQLVHALLPAGGAVLTIEGPSISPAAIHRREGFAEHVGPQIKLVKSLTGDWSQASAERALGVWLQLGARKERPDLIAAQNDLMALGARTAVRSLRPEWSEVHVIGCDGLPDGGQRLIREGVLTATVVQPTTTGVCLDLVARSLRGEAVPASTVLQPSLFPSLEELRRSRRG